MAGLARTGRSSQPTIPPPTCYKPPPMKSITSCCKSSTNKTNTSTIWPMKNTSTTAYGTATPFLMTDNKSTMTQPTQQLHKLPLFPKLQKSIKMTNEHSKVITRTTVQPPSHPFPPHSQICHPSAANLANQPNKLHPSFSPIRTHQTLDRKSKCDQSTNPKQYNNGISATLMPNPQSHNGTNND